MKSKILLGKCLLCLNESLRLRTFKKYAIVICNVCKSTWSCPDEETARMQVKGGK